MSDSKLQTVNILSSLYSLPLISDRLKLVVEILITYNPRISEILNLRDHDLYPDQYIIIPGLKKSEAIVIRDKDILIKIQNLKPNGSSMIFYPIKYYQVYHFIKSHYGHLLKKIKIKKNKKITHAFRYLNIEPLVNDTDIKLILHHRSLRSGNYYKNKLKAKQ
jgi:hypothetical protein